MAIPLMRLPARPPHGQVPENYATIRTALVRSRSLTDRGKTHKRSAISRTMSDANREPAGSEMTCP
jgi:hypothetical protein